MKSRVKTSLRYVDEYLNGKRYNPRLCLTEEEAVIVSKALPYPLLLKKGNLVSKEHLYMWKIRKI